MVARTIRLTDYNEPLTLLNGEVFLPQDPGSGSATRSKADGSSSDTEVHAFITSDLITEEDVIRGLWEGAIIDEILIDFRFPYLSPFSVRRYVASSITIDGGIINMQANSILNSLNNPVGEIWGPMCRVQVFSQSDYQHAGCNLDPNFWKIDVIAGVETALPRRVYLNAASISGDWVNDGWGTFGTAEFLNGPNAGIKVPIKTYDVDAGTYTLILQKVLPYPYVEGDVIRLLPGCNKLRDGDCFTKFNNVINFQGEPDIPGRDKALEIVI